jgi:tellurite resistance protein
MPGFIDEVIDAYRTTMERHRNRPFLNAAMAGCALAATATGEVSFSERIRVDQVLETLERLEVFDPHEGVELFNAFCDAILQHPRQGRERATAALAPFTGDRDSASLLVRICLAVADAGGTKSLTQEIEIVMLCSVLGVDPAGAGLYIDTAHKPDGRG